MHMYFGVMASFNYFMFHPLTPKSDQHLISPYNIASESKKITRIKEMFFFFFFFFFNKERNKGNVTN